MRTASHLLWLLSAVCFVVGLHLMGTPSTARRGNLLSAAGMGLAVLVTAAVLADEGVFSGRALVVLFVAAVFAAMNVVGGYVVTDRMLEMFRVKGRRQ